MSSDLDQVSLLQRLGSWAPEVRFFEEIDSTNTYAAEWVAAGALDGSIVIADHQTAGRGRLDRDWLDAPGGSLMTTLILRPEMEVELLSILGLAVGSVWAETLSALGFEAGVKWPNDILVDGLKAGGILSEVHGRACIIGCGINVNLKSSDLGAMEDGLGDSATSLLVASGKTWDRGELLEAFVGGFADLYRRSPGDPSAALDHYRKWCRTLGSHVSILVGDKTISGIASDIDPRGGLVLDSGQIHYVGDVTHLR